LHRFGAITIALTGVPIQQKRRNIIALIDED
jgi:hypothetical protein